MAAPETRMPEIIKNKFVIGGAALAAIVIALFVFGGSGSAPKAGDFTFETATVERGEVASVISAAGAVQPVNKVDVGSEVSGKIVKLFVDFNDTVTEGQVLAQIDPETFQNAVEQASARLLQSQASVANARSAIERSKVNLDVAEKDFKRKEALFKEQAISQAVWEQTEQAFKYAQLELRNNEVALQSANAGYSQSKASLEEAKLRLDRTNILSPIDGVVLSRAVEVGQTVQSSMSVAKFFTIAEDLSQIQIEAAVLEQDIGGIDSGDPVTFEVDAFPGETFRGQVSQVRKQGAESANIVTYTVVVSARNPNGKLLPGMTANAEITADRVNDVLRIAQNATSFTPPRALLEKFEDDTSNGQQRRPGGFPGGGEGRGGNPFDTALTEMGIDQDRIQKISTEFRSQMETMRASMQASMPSGGNAFAGGGGGGPPRSIQMQAQMQEFRKQMQAAQDDILKRNLSPDEIVEFNRVRATLQSQKRVNAYFLNEAGELDRKMIVVGLSDGSNAEIISGAEEGDQFVMRAVPASTKK